MSSEEATMLHSTALYPVHQRSGAHIVPFAGWQMPLRYTSDLAEHRAVRASAGLFDLSHMAQIEVSGPGSAAALSHALVGVYGTMPAGKAKYTMMVDESGGVLDDIIVYRLDDLEYLVIANAANRETVLDRFIARSTRFDVQFFDHTFSRAMIALQGPRAAEILGTLVPPEVLALRYYSIASTDVAGIPVLVARTGYTGEDGFELIGPAESATPMWEALQAAGAPFGLVPCGLAARDTLRLEAGMPLYGNELSTEVTPYHANLGRVVDLEHDFVGRDALAGRTAPDSRLVGLVGEGRRAARAGTHIYADGRPIGAVTSGVLSPTLGYPIAMALVENAWSEPGTTVIADVRGTEFPMEIVPLPFYRRA